MFFKVARQGENQWYWWLITCIMVAAAFFVGLIPAFAYLQANGITDPTDIANIDIDKNLWLTAQLIPFAFGLVALLACVKYIHKRSPLSILTSASRFRWGRYLFGFGIAIGIIGAGVVVSYLSGEGSIDFNFNPEKFIPLLIIAMILIPLQAGFEEVFFRGYLLQGLGNSMKSRFGALLVTSTVFGLLHSGNPEVVEHGFVKMMPLYISMGLSFGLMTLLDDGIELATGYHTGNNLAIVLLLTSPEAALQTDALFQQAEVVERSYLQMWAPILLNAIVLIVFAFKYKWRDWKGHLFGPVTAKELPQNLL